MTLRRFPSRVRLCLRENIRIYSRQTNKQWAAEILRWLPRGPPHLVEVTEASQRLMLNLSIPLFLVGMFPGDHLYVTLLLLKDYGFCFYIPLHS